MRVSLISTYKAKGYYYIFHEGDASTSFVHLQYILPVPLPESLKSLLQAGIFLLRPRSQYDTEPVNFPFEFRLEALSRVQRA